MTEPTIVPGVGPLNCKIAIIGEAPGEREILLGRPFVGASGDMLNRLLSTAGINRAECYVTNVIKERPPSNKIEHFLEIKLGRAIEKGTYHAYESILHEELEKCTANILILLGSTALYALTKKTKITSQRGSLQLSTTGRKCLPSLHPSYCLRDYLAQYPLLHDLKLALAESESSELKLPQRTLRIRPTFYEAESYMRSCLFLTRVGFDIETDAGGEVSCFSLAKSPTDVMSVPLTEKGSDYFVPEQEIVIWNLLAQILENKTIQKWGQNIIFDASFMLRKLRIRTVNVRDTMIAQAMVAAEFPKGLDFITSMYTREPYYKDEGKKWFKLTGSQEDFWRYNAKDSAVVVEALPVIEKDIERMRNKAAYLRQTNIIKPLMYIQEHGIRVDLAGLARAREALQQDISNERERLNVLCGMEINPASPKQIAEYFYVRKGLKPYIDRKTGKPTTDEDALKRIAAKGYEEARCLMSLRHKEKLCGTYYEMTFDADGRLRTSINQVGTKSGRVSSGKTIFGTGGNMQNMPPEFRKYLLADEGYICYNIDLSQAENRIVAYCAPEPAMIAAFEHGIDIHSQTAALIFRKAIEEVSDRAGSCAIGSGQYSERFWGKKANHGLNYDLGYKQFAYLYEIPERDGKFIRDSYFSAYPGVKNYHRWIQADLGKDRSLTNCFGRRRIFYDRWGDDLFKEAYSFIPQSTVADIINERGLLFIDDNQDLFSSIELMNQIHDSIIFQVPVSVPWEKHLSILKSIKRSLETTLEWRGFRFSIPADIEVGLNLMKYDKEKPYAGAMRKVKELSVKFLAETYNNLINEIQKESA